MTPKQLENIVHLKPFKPYRLVLTSGEQILVNRPRKSHVSGSVVSLVGQVTRKRGGASADQFRIIRVNDVVSAEHVDVPVLDR
jgi:hypothetical protein